eukprot:Awhi_evm1s10538
MFLTVYPSLLLPFPKQNFESISHCGLQMLSTSCGWLGYLSNETNFVVEEVIRERGERVLKNLLFNFSCFDKSHQKVMLSALEPWLDAETYLYELSEGIHQGEGDIIYRIATDDPAPFAKLSYCDQVPTNSSLCQSEEETRKEIENLIDILEQNPVLLYPCHQKYVQESSLLNRMKSKIFHLMGNGDNSQAIPYYQVDPDFAEYVCNILDQIEKKYEVGRLCRANKIEKRVSFDTHVYLAGTYNKEEYDRKGQIAPDYSSLEAWFHVFQWLNIYKANEMIVHPSSTQYTHFYSAEKLTMNFPSVNTITETPISIPISPPSTPLGNKIYCTMPQERNHISCGASSQIPVPHIQTA